MALTTEHTGTKGPGLLSRVTTLVAEGGAILAELDPDRLTGEDASALYAQFAGLERIAVGAKTLLAPRVENSGVWKEGGHKDAAGHLAALEGVSPGQARGTLVNGRRLGELPATEQAVREGTLSAPKVSELCGAAILDPDRESELLAGAADQPLTEVKERCQRSRATSARRDPMATQRRIRNERFFIWWTDADGAFCFKGRDTADRGARILNHLRHAADLLEKEHRTRVRQEAGANSAATTGASSTNASSGPGGPDGTGTLTQKALWADAFFAVVTQQTMGVPVPEPGVAVPEPTAETGAAAPSTAAPDADEATDAGADADADAAGSARAGTGKERAPGSTPPPASTPSDPRPPPTGDALSVITRPPDSTVVVLVDIEAWRRGRTEPGECCEITSQGPIPVPMARDLANDSFLSVLFHQAGDIRAVSHLGRTINAKLRTALLYRDRTCVVPGCGVSSGLEIDHVREFHLGGPTELDNLALLCHHHHQLKTYQGWVLTRLGVDQEGRTRWRFEPEPPFGQEPGLGIDTDEGRAEWHREQRLE